MKLFSLLFSRTKDNSDAFAVRIKEIIGYYPNNINIFKEAFTHKSNDTNWNYERLEFLGDSIIAASVAHHLFLNKKDFGEGELTVLKSKLVSRKNLNQIGKNLNFKTLIKSTFSSTDIPENMYGNVLEAIIGAIYIDGGHVKSEMFIKVNVVDQLSSIDFSKIQNYKGKLLEWGSKEHKIVNFNTVMENYTFKSEIFVDEVLVCEGRGKNKKEAEQDAAKRALEKLQVNILETD